MLASPQLPARDAVALRLVLLGRRGAAGATSASASSATSAATSSTASARRRCCTSSSPTGRATSATAPPASRCAGYEIELRGEDGQPVSPTARSGDLYIQGPSAALMYWGNRQKSARDLPAAAGPRAATSTSRDADGYYTYAGRSDDMLKVSGIYVSPFEVEATLVQHPAVLEAAVIGKDDARRPDQDQGLRRAEERRRRDGRGRAEGLREGAPRALQVPALHRVRRRAAEDRHRQDPALPPARARAARREHDAPIAPPIRMAAAGRAHRIRCWIAPERRRRAAPRLPARRPGLALRCGAIFPSACATPAACAASSTRGPATAARRRARRRDAGTSTSCTARRTRCCRRLLRGDRRIEPSRPGCFGHSDGGSIALLFAASFPEQRRRRSSCSRRTSSSRTCRSPASSRPRRLPVRPTCARSSPAITTTPTPRSGAGTTSGWIRPSAQWNIESELAAHPSARCWRSRASTTNTARCARSTASPSGCRRRGCWRFPDCGHSPHRDQPETAIVATVSFVKTEDAPWAQPRTCERNSVTRGVLTLGTVESMNSFELSTVATFDFNRKETFHEPPHRTHHPDRPGARLYRHARAMPSRAS